jgi:hydroxymethylglutaryl-CoA lyase
MAISYTRNVQLVECPRDAMQGRKTFIPTEKKIAYINSLLKVGFHTLDCGSFVSVKAIPQMADTKEVLSQINRGASKTKLLVIVANIRGAQEAVAFDNVAYLGFPFSLSPTFQLKNVNSTIEDSVQRIDEIQNLCLKNNKELVVYLSMGFGNPYGDEYDDETLLHWADEMVKKNIKIISLADTVGVATPDQINFALQTLIPAYPQVQFGVHLHCSETTWREKLEAAVDAGCQRFDGALKGFGGCPMAKDELVGNMNTERMIEYFKDRNIMPAINEQALQEALRLADTIFI